MPFNVGGHTTVVHPHTGISAVKMTKLLVDTTAWTNHKYSMLNERSQTQRAHAMRSHLYDILEYAKLPEQKNGP